jgi:putative membrane protein
VGARRPRGVYEGGEEPDPRFTLANERTFLAWVRTSLGLLAAGVALESLGLPDSPRLRTTLAVTLIVLGGTVIALAWLRWGRVERALRHATPLPPFSLGLTITLALVAVSGLLAVALILL